MLNVLFETKSKSQRFLARVLAPYDNETSFKLLIRDTINDELILCLRFETAHEAENWVVGLFGLDPAF